MSKIDVKYNGKLISVDRGTTIREIVGTGRVPYEENPIVGATLMGEMVCLSTPLVSDSRINPIHLFSPLGKRIYRHSICFLLSYAVSSIFRDKHLVIGHSLGDGYYYSLKLTEEEIKLVRDKMMDTVKAELDIQIMPLSYLEALDYFNKETSFQTNKLLQSLNNNYINAYRLDDYIDTSFEPLVDNTFILSNWQLNSYQDGFLLRYPQSRDFKKLQTFTDYPLLFSVFQNGHAKEKILGVECIGELNEKIAEGRENEIIELEEAWMNRNISDIAQNIENKGTCRIVTIAGPSSSGKTTFSLKLGTQLKLLGYDPVKISLDDYYLTQDKVPVDEKGEKDFEVIEALDLEFFSMQIESLLEGKAINLPQFSFKENKRYFKEEKTNLKDNTILLIEGIHGLNPKLLPNLDTEWLYKIYISALTSVNIDDHNRISTTDNRIIRRIVRDNRTRGTKASKTLAMWPSVENGEKNHIFPFQNQADHMYNSAHTYEMAVLAPIAQSLLRSVKPETDMAYSTARRLLKFLELFYPISSENIPQNSLIREFIGGSIYKAI